MTSKGHLEIYNMKLDSLIESILYYKGEPMAKKELCKMLEVAADTLKEALILLRKNLEGRGVTLVETDDEVSLGAAKESAEMIEKISKEEMNREIGKAGLETLTIVAYKGPIGRSAIDNIRGVNSSFILRNLMIRGLIERMQDPSDQRAFLYKPSMQLLNFLGLAKIDDLPEYIRISQELKEPAKPEDDKENKPNIG